MENNNKAFIEARNKMARDYYGPIKSPKDLVNHYIHMGRQLGKTTTLLMSLPNTPCIVVTSRSDHWNEMKRTLVTLRPDYDVKNVINITYDVFKLANFERIKLEKLRGRPDWNTIPIYVDNCVLDMMQLDFIELINRGVM